MRPISLRSITVIRPKKPISRLTSTRALMTVRINPSGIARDRLHGARAGAAGPRPRHAPGPAGQRARESCRSGQLAAVEAHQHLLAGRDPEPLGVLVVQQDVTRALEE